MTSSRVHSASRKTVDYGDWVITLVLLVAMVSAYVLTLGWPSGTAFFPRLLSATSIIFILLKLASLVWNLFAAPPAAVASPAPPVVAPGLAADGAAKAEGEITLVTDVDEDQGNEDEFHKIFARADGRMWADSIGWIVLFFVGLYLFGLLVTLPIFTVLYLRFVAKSSWLVCFLYVLGTAGVIFLLFDLVLHLPLPPGIFPLFGE